MKNIVFFPQFLGSSYILVIYFDFMISLHCCGYVVISS